MIRAPKLKQMVEEGLVWYRSIFREMKKRKRQKLWCISIKLHWVCLLLQLNSSTSPLLLPLPPLRQQNQFIFFLLLSPLNVKMMKMNTFMMIYFHLKSSKYPSCYTVNKLTLYMHVSSCENLLIRIIWGVLVSSSSLPKYSSCKTSCIRPILRLTDYSYIGIRWVIFNIKLIMC